MWMGAVLCCLLSGLKIRPGSILFNGAPMKFIITYISDRENPHSIQNLYVLKSNMNKKKIKKHCTATFP